MKTFSDVNLSCGCVRRRCSFDHRHREVGITMAGSMSAILHGGVDDTPGLVPSTVVTGVTGWWDGEVERRDALGRLPRDASAQRAPYLRYTFARKTRWTYLARLLRLRPLSSSPPVSFYITTLRISANQINYSHEYNYQPADILSSFR